MSHKDDIPKSLKIAILSVSSTRSISNDESGEWIKKSALKEGYEVVYHDVVQDKEDDIIINVLAILKKFQPNALLLTGGTGISEKDVTIEAVKQMFRKELTAFSIIFALLSYKNIGSSAILSRAAAGIIKKTVVFCLPGSLKACKLACEDIIWLELGHITKHILQKD